MPQLISLKFSEKEMPRRYDPASVADLKPADFVVAERAGSTDVGIVAGIEWVSKKQIELRRDPLKRIIRRATEEEKEAFFLRKARERDALILCKEKAEEMKLPMKVSTARVDPKDGRIVFQFTSDQRVDFRQLVRELSMLLKTRIELWQIGVRDEARVVDGLGICGLQTCCSSWLTEFRPINIRMAKTQDINLPPPKLSGQCGRLLCCLSYEVDQYRDMAKSLLPKGATITVDGEDGVIIDRNIIRQAYVVRIQKTEAIITVTADQMEDVRVPEQMKRMAKAFTTKKKEEEDNGEGPDASPWREEASRSTASAVVEEAPPHEDKRAAPPEPDSDDDQKKSGRRGKRRRRGKRTGSPTDAGGPQQAGHQGDKPERPRPPKAEAKGSDGPSGKPAEAKGGDGDQKKGSRKRRRRGGRRGRGSGKKDGG